MGESILDGSTPREALEALLRRGMRRAAGGRAGAAWTSCAGPRPAPRARCASAGRLDGTLEQVRDAAGQGHRAGAGGAVPRPVRRRPAAGSRARHAARRPGAGGPRARRLRMALHRGPADLRADPGPAAPRGARQPVPRHEAGSGERVPEPTCSRVKDMLAALNSMLEAGRPRRGHRRSSSPTSWRSSATSSRTTRRTWRSWSTRWPGAPPPHSELMRTLSPEQRAGAGRPDRGHPGRRGAGRRRCRGCSDALQAARPDLDWGQRPDEAVTG